MARRREGRAGWASRNDDQLGDGDDALDGHGDRRRVSITAGESLLAKNFEVGGKAGNSGLGKSGHFGLALIPPVGEASLRVDVD